MVLLELANMSSGYYYHAMSVPLVMLYQCGIDCNTISYFNIMLLLLYGFFLCYGEDVYRGIKFIVYKIKYTWLKKRLISNKWYYDISTYNESRKCELSLYKDMSYTLSVNRKDKKTKSNSDNDNEITIIEEGFYYIVSIDVKSSIYRIDLLSKNVSEQRFDMLLYNKKNKDKIEAYRKEVDFYDKEAKVVFSQD